MEGRKHPPELAPSQATIVRVVHYIFVIVPFNEIIPQSRQKGHAADNHHDDRGEPSDQATLSNLLGKGS